MTATAWTWRRRPTITAGRLYVPVMAGLTIAIGILAVQSFVALAGSEGVRLYGLGNGDQVGYFDGARRFLETGSPYESGPLVLHAHTFIHPPIALALFLPFLVLPTILWWLIPLVGTAVLVVSARPSPWTWPLIAACLLWPRSQGAILSGGSDMWAMLFVALGVRFRWPVVALLVKPTFLPLAIVGIRDRRTWIAGAIAALAMLPLIPLWIQWIGVVRQIDGGPIYSLAALPLVALPLLLWRPLSDGLR